MEPEVKKYKFLVVEDSTITRINIHKILRTYFESSHILLTITKSEAYEAYKENPDIDLMIIDLDINSGNGSNPSRANTGYNVDKGATVTNALGLLLMKEIRAENNQVILIAFTNFDDEALKKEILSINAHYLKKRTFSHEPLKLITLVLRLLGKPLVER